MMNEPFEFLPHTADAGIVARGATLAALFENAARGMFAYLSPAEGTDEPFTVTVEARGIDRETLLVAWLSELLYLGGRERVRLEDFRIRVLSDTHLVADVVGCRLRVPGGTEREIKAVTYHELAITRSPAGFAAKIIFDV